MAGGVASGSRVGADQLPDIFQYLDYRAFLADRLRALGAPAASGARFSLRNVSKRAGFKSPSFLSMVCSRKRHLSTDSIQPLARCLQLSEREQEYFELITLLGLSESEENRRLLTQKIRICFHTGLFREMIGEGNAFARAWYLPVLREICGLQELSLTAKTTQDIAGQLGLTEDEVKEGFELLLQEGFLQSDESGRLRRSEPSVHNFGKTSEFVLLNYYIQLLEKSIKATTQPKDQKYFESLTLAIPRRLMPDLKEHIKRFFREIDMLAESQQDRDRVCQLNLQLFTAYEEKGERQ